MPRVRDFSDQERARCVGDVAAHPHDEAASKEHGVRVTCSGESLDQGTENDEQASDSRPESSSAVVCYVRSEEQHCEAAEARERA